MGLREILKGYGKSQIEDQDVFAMVRTLIDGETQWTEFALRLIQNEFPSLASFVSERFGFGSVRYEDEFIPTCNQPFNKGLHNLPMSGEVVIKDTTQIMNFAVHLNRSRFIAVDFQIVKEPEEEDKGVVSIVSFCTRSKVFFLMPLAFPETVQPIVAALKSDPKMVFVYQWHARKDACLGTLDWVPEQVVDVQQLAREIGIGDTLDAITEKTVGGNFCRRASQFPHTVMPSAPALHHRAIRVTLFYEFAVQEKKLREAGETRKMTRYDREGEGVESRLDRKKR